MALHEGQFERALRLAEGQGDFVSQAMPWTVAAHSLAPDALAMTQHIASTSELHRAQSAAHISADQGTELVQGWRDCERAVLDAANLLLQGRLDDFRESHHRGRELSETVGNPWTQRRLTLLALYVATLRGDPGHLREAWHDLGEQMPTLIRSGPLYGLGGNLLRITEGVVNPAWSGASGAVETCSRLIRDGFELGIDYPVMLRRIRALALLRKGDYKRARDDLRWGVERAEAEGWRLEAAIARVQIAELAPVLNIAPLDVAADRVFLRGAGIVPEVVGYHVLRSQSLSRRRAVVTERQQQIIDLAGQGLRAPEIAIRLGVKASTIRWHSKQIKARLGTEGLTAMKATALIALSQQE